LKLLNPEMGVQTDDEEEDEEEEEEEEEDKEEAAGARGAERSSHGRNM